MHIYVYVCFLYVYFMSIHFMDFVSFINNYIPYFIWDVIIYNFWSRSPCYFFIFRVGIGDYIPYFIAGLYLLIPTGYIFVFDTVFLYICLFFPCINKCFSTC